MLPYQNRPEAWICLEELSVESSRHAPSVDIRDMTVGNADLLYGWAPLRALVLVPQEVLISRELVLLAHVVELRPTGYVVRGSVLPFRPKYRLGHPGNYLFLL